MKILCTGNPNDCTVASAVQRQFTNVDFASRVTGFDLRFWDAGSENHYRTVIKNYNVLINSSFICSGGQLALLECTHEVWSQHNITGHIINIGSTAEWLGIDSVYGSYSIQKRALRDRSLQLNMKNNIKTSHIIAGGLNDNEPGHEKWLPLDSVADAIKWIINHPYCIPLLQIQAK